MKKRSRRTVILTLLSLIGAMCFFPAYVYSQTVAGCPDNDIAHYWTFNESSEPTPGVEAFADFVGGINATCTAGLDCPGVTAGRINNALLFNETVGETDSISVAADTSFDWSAPASFSIEFWMKTPSSSTCAGNQVIVGRNDSSVGLHWWVGCSGTGGVADFTLYNTSGAALVKGTTDLSDGRWHHVVAVRDGTANTISIYVDGVKEGWTGQTYSAGFASTQPLNIGWLNQDPYYRFSGMIDEMAIYNGVLPENEIKQHYYDGAVGLGWGYCGCDSPVYIMPMGDSITDGYIPGQATTYGEMVGYRSTLWHDLTDAGFDFHFTGSQEAGQTADPVFEPWNEGHGGITTGDVANNVYGWLGVNTPPDITPNVVLLHIGTNDYTDPSNPLPNSVDNVQTILDQIDQFEADSGSHVTVVLARIVNQATPAPEVTTFNNDVVDMAQNRIANGDRIIIVDQEHALTYPDDMSDTLHPNVSGYDKMAQVWMNALAAFLPMCGPIPPTITSNPITQAYVGLPYTYDVDSIGAPAPTYSITTNPDPSGMSINSYTGLLEWTPASTGSFQVTVQADNTVNPPATQSFTIRVDGAPQCPSALTHYWNLDETSGPPYIDFYGAASGVCGTACPIATAGKINGAQQFNGTDEVNVADDNSFDWHASASFSIEFWMKTDSSSTCSGNQVIVGRTDQETSLQWWVGCSGAGGEADFNLYDTSGSGTFVKGATDLTDGQWHHVVAVRDGVANTISIYVDGVKEGWTGQTYSVGFASDRPLNIGWLNQDPYYRFEGTVDDVAIYSRALSYTEIMQHFSDGEAGYGYCIMDGTTTYTVTPSVVGSGSMTPSTPQHIRDGSTTTFIVTPDTGYLIDSVTGCGGTLIGSSYTTGSITGNCTVTAQFAVNPNLHVRRTSGPNTYYYSTLQSAYDPATIQNGDVIQSEAMSFDEDLTFDLDVQITLEGGYDTQFQSHDGYTTVGSLTVSKGTVVLDRLVLQ